FFQAEDGIRDRTVTGVQTCALPISILMEIDQEAQTTKRVLERIPEDKLSWKPHPKAFSLGQLALHIASVPGSVATAAAPDTMEEIGRASCRERVYAAWVA